MPKSGAGSSIKLKNETRHTPTLFEKASCPSELSLHTHTAASSTKQPRYSRFL